MIESKMTKEELKKWFFDKFNNCYLVKHDDYPESIFMHYDDQWIRQKKLSRLTGEKLEYPSNISGKLLFEQDYKNGYLFMDYFTITTFFYENYSSKWLEIRELIKGWLEEHAKMKVLAPSWNFNIGVTCWKNMQK